LVSIPQYSILSIR